MKELEFINIIKEQLSSNSYIGDDCAYLKELGIVVTHDSFVEDIHFSLRFSTPYMLGYKSVIANLSDIFASGALPKYLTISLSLPNDIEDEFVSEFYRAVNDLSQKFNFEVIGGDITGADKIFVSICAIGVTSGRNIASRSFAKVGDLVVVTGEHGASAAGLWCLNNGIDIFESLIDAHLKPKISLDFASEIATKSDRSYAMMDSSDGLVDALYKIASASDVSIEIDFSKVLTDESLKNAAEMAKKDYKDWVLFGGEDFKIISCIDEENLSKIQSSYKVVGKVIPKQENYLVSVCFDNEKMLISDLEKTFNHFSS